MTQLEPHPTAAIFPLIEVPVLRLSILLGGKLLTPILKRSPQRAT
ncbi:hypothetical protein GA0061099_103021 [Bradyrhizobium yuanmingense]|uniref:Uncharacterized protein n=1 Tax=Bradyrhizobium yuanmingense TaxID=108015 RepID=A0A1C3XJ39_9BRAD|nr:hypothetical protein [Bradyrhizobium yuanmingense]TWI17772.1 hypothetical protein IQ15_07362 [Bradyrhizobium yuanmingense]SCB52280.1 hypothetical protein GA0061099_103021 [Bradyrhizobium yuanmingense]